MIPCVHIGSIASYSRIEATRKLAREGSIRVFLYEFIVPRVSKGADS